MTRNDAVNAVINSIMTIAHSRDEQEQTEAALQLLDIVGFIPDIPPRATVLPTPLNLTKE